MKKTLLACALGLAALAVTPAYADEFSFSFSGPDFSGSGDLYATASGTPGQWDITYIDGSVTVDGHHGSTTYTIGALDPAAPASGSYDGNDNILYLPPGISLSGFDYFDTQGVSFSLLGTSNNVNLDTGIGWFIVPYLYNQGNDGSTSEALTSECVTWVGSGDPPSATPEPSSLALLGTSILGAAGLLRRRFVA
jgi:hypothetical protein